MLRRIVMMSLMVVLSLGLCAGSVLAQEQTGDKPAAKGTVKINKFKDGKLNLNAATKEDLAKIEEITPEMADAILEQRKENGEFVDLDELLDIEGMDNTLLRKLERKIYLEPASDCNC